MYLLTFFIKSQDNPFLRVGNHLLLLFFYPIVELHIRYGSGSEVLQMRRMTAIVIGSQNFGTYKVVGCKYFPICSKVVRCSNVYMLFAWT
jgi:hypothetical protein